MFVVLLFPCDRDNLSCLEMENRNCLLWNNRIQRCAIIAFSDKKKSLVCVSVWIFYSVLCKLFCSERMLATIWVQVTLFTLHSTVASVKLHFYPEDRADWWLEQTLFFYLGREEFVYVVSEHSKPFGTAVLTVSRSTAHLFSVLWPVQLGESLWTRWGL